MNLSSLSIDGNPATISLPQRSLPRFGVVLCGFQFVLPEKIACDYILRAQLFSLPLAPSRLIGLVHSRGFGIPVFDAGYTVRERQSMKLSEPVLVIGQGGQAGALIVDQAPALLNLEGESTLFDELSLEEQVVSPTQANHPAFAGLEIIARRGRLSDSNDPSSLWWQLSFDHLFARLSQLKGH
jgi:hypothetical protein